MFIHTYREEGIELPMIDHNGVSLLHVSYVPQD